ncbi:MAG: winged helix-turn-helix domain-containing protein [Candidatus Thermoplasmatota archaeon]
MSKEEELDEEELKEEIESLRDQVEGLENMLENLMTMHKNVLEKASVASEVEEKYMKMISIYKKFGHISPAQVTGIKDPISEKIVEILFDTSPLNITQITGRLREKKGSASRHTVRKKLKELEEKGVVKEAKHEGKKGKHYELTDETVSKWAELLGINK